MTGYGCGEADAHNYRVTVEIKAVNHRYNEILVRLPKNCNALEERVRRKIAAVLHRGHMDVFITVNYHGQRQYAITVDNGLAIAYYNAVKGLAQTLAIPETGILDLVARFPEVITVEEEPDDVEVIWPVMDQALTKALNGVKRMRQAEGENIYRDITRRVERLEQLREVIAQRAHSVVDEYRNKLLNRLGSIVNTADIDMNRVLQEVVLFADRSNITEELVRLASHVQQFSATLAGEGAVGRKLDFLVQEMNREVNTIAAKANDADIIGATVEMKSEIEKVREQIQNIE